MERRTFLGLGATAAALAGGGLASRSWAQVTGEKTGADLRTRIAVSPNWFAGGHVQQIEQIAAAGFRAFENLGAGGWEDREAVRQVPGIGGRLRRHRRRHGDDRRLGTH